jgi:cytochrome c biogenesis protein CcmG/thiol:disulfide interchange protein DsbE
MLPGEGFMKRVAIIVLTVAALIGVTIYADYATRLHPKTGMTVSTSSVAGQPEPDLKLKDLDGKDVSLAGLKGNVVLVNFWATWCDPCRVEIPWLIEVQAKYGSRGFTVVGIAMDDEGKSAVAPFVEKERFDVSGQQLPMSYPIWLGSDEAADKFGGILGYPTSFLISRDGKQVEKYQGLLNYDQLVKDIESQL